MQDKLCEPMAPLDGDPIHSIQTYNTACLCVIITQAFIKKLTDSGDLAPRRVSRWPLVPSMAACYTRAGLRGVQAYLQRHHKITYFILQTLYFITKTFVKESPLPAKRGVFD